ncbi:septum formation topological specificity factor MinE [Lachnospiraceae bacterium PF1-22]
MKANKITAFLLVGALMLGITGCGSKAMIFQERKLPDSITPIKTEQLKAQTYYIKDGTDFFSTYKGEGSSTGSVETAMSTKILWNTQAQDDLIPTLYQDEVIAYATAGDIPDDFRIERYKDLGFSIGIRQLESGEQYYKASASSNIKPGSSFASLLSETSISTIGISAVDGKRLTDDDVSKSGTILGLKKGKEYQVELYAGSSFTKETLKADTHVFQSSEVIQIDDFVLTKNGYIQIEMPNSLKTGYYNIEGVGMFRYIAERKCVAKAFDKYDYNERNTDTISTAVDDTLEVDYITKNIKVDEDYKTITFMVSEKDNVEIKDISITLPDKTQAKLKKKYETAKEWEYTTDIEEESAPQGNYKVKITGKNVEELEVVVDYGMVVQKAEKKEKEDEKKEDSNEDVVITEPNANTPSTSNPTNATGNSSNSSGGSSYNSNSGTSVDEDEYIYYEKPVNDPLTSPDTSETMPGQ